MRRRRSVAHLALDHLVGAKRPVLIPLLVAFGLAVWGTQIVWLAGREFRHGSLEQFSIYSESTVVILTVITAGYFLVLVLDRDAVIGRARMLSRLTRERLFPEFT